MRDDRISNIRLSLIDDDNLVNVEEPLEVPNWNQGTRNSINDREYLTLEEIAAIDAEMI